MQYLVQNNKVIHPATGEIVADLVNFQRSQKRVVRQHTSKAQLRAATHFHKALWALGGCTLLALLIAFVAVNY